MWEDDPYLQGVKAYENGKNRHNNPYNFGCFAYSMWDKGWSDRKDGRLTEIWF